MRIVRKVYNVDASPFFVHRTEHWPFSSDLDFFIKYNIRGDFNTIVWNFKAGFNHFYLNSVLSSTKVIIRPLKTAITQGKNYFKNIFWNILFSIYCICFCVRVDSSGGFKVFISKFQWPCLLLLLLSSASKIEIEGFFFMIIFCNESSFTSRYFGDSTYHEREIN